MTTNKNKSLSKDKSAYINIESHSVILTLIVVFLLTLNPLKPFGNLIMIEDKRNLVTKDKQSPLTKVQELPFVQDENKIMGAYIPDSLHLEDMNETNQTLAIWEFLKQGFDEYFFVMDNFRDAKEVGSTERLLNGSRLHRIENNHHSFTSLRRRSSEQL